MAEVIGSISAVISIIDAIAKTYRQAKNTKDLPDVFLVIDRQIDIVRGILERAQDQYPETGTQDDEVVHKILDGCKSDIQNLEELFEKILTGPDDDVTTRIRKPLQNFFRDRKAKIEEVWKKIMEYIQLLDAYHGFTGLNAKKHLSRPIAQIEEVEDSLPETESCTTIYSSGPGANFNTGKGSQQNTQTFNNNYYSSAGSDDRYSIKASSNSSVTHNEIHHYNYAAALEHHSKQTLVRNALFLTDPESDRRSVVTVKGPRVSGTCEWLLRTDKFRSWLAGKGSRLWISGRAGQGKTMIAIFFTERLRELFKEQGLCSMIYFFCDHQNDKRNSTLGILRGLLYQLMAMDPQLSDMFHDKYFGFKELEKNTLTSEETLWTIFEQSLRVLSRQRQVVCVIDGLDECGDSTVRFISKQFTTGFSTSQAGTQEYVPRVVLISRDVRPLDSWPRIQLNADNDHHIEADVALFLQERMKELRTLQGFNDIVYETVYTTLLGRSEGTFLWIGLAMQELLEKETCTEVLQALKGLPRGLPWLYRRMIHLIAPGRRSTAIAIFRWTLFGKERLSLAALAEAVGIRPLPGLGCEQAVRDYVTACKGLLIVDDTVDVREVRLLHQSLYDYLTDVSSGFDHPSTMLHMTPEKGHCDLLKDCIVFMEDSRGQAWFSRLSPKERIEWKFTIRDNKLDDRLSRRPQLLHYAARHWPTHARAAKHVARQTYHDSFFQPHKSKLLLKLAYTSHHLSPDDSTLHFACELCLPFWLDELLKGQTDVSNSVGRQSGYVERKKPDQQIVDGKPASEPAPIDRVSRSGYSLLGLTPVLNTTTEGVELAQVLFKHGANPNNINRASGLTVLEEAMWRGNSGLVELLLEHGASTNCKPDGTEAPLAKAIDFSEVDMVQSLLRHGADANGEVCPDGLPLLHFASRKGNPEIVQLLLDHGAGLNTPPPGGWETALHEAVWWGHVEVIKVLLRHGANVHGTSNQDESPLHSGVRKNCLEAVQLMLSFGADIDLLDCYGKTPLLVAIYLYHVDMTAELLGRGAAVDIIYSKGRTALHCLVEHVHRDRTCLRQGMQIARLLLKHGAAINAKDDLDCSALSLAKILELRELVKLFQEAGMEARIEKGEVQIGAMR